MWVWLFWRTSALLTRNCRCHDEPMDRDRSTRGGWRCSVKRREKQLRYWHKANGGYVVRRRRHLRAERADINERLLQLKREGASAQ